LLIANFYLVDFQGTLSIKYTVFGLILPLLALISLLIKAKRPADFHQASTLTKFIMLIGLLYAVIFNFLLAQDTGILFINLFNVH
jgi:4-hydroxybenzoate polyprenyltransferase